MKPMACWKERFSGLIGKIEMSKAKLAGVQTDNARLIFRRSDVAGEPRHCGRVATLMNHADIPSANPDLEHGGGLPVRGRLNAFFAISVNSPAMRMVNFSCGVGFARNASVRGVTRTVPPQPMRAATRMEAGAHARL
jgi:hypothetical protein